MPSYTTTPPNPHPPNQPQIERETHQYISLYYTHQMTVAEMFVVVMIVDKKTYHPFFC